ncbi:MAG: hypothetical protein NTW94_04290 [Legionellales bacterium]|nr:hypothetical protein [Legionellales bacterium]
MNIIFRIIFSFVALSMVACTSPKVSVQRANDRVFCLATCQQKLQHCLKACSNNTAACHRASCQQSRHDYQQYVHEQCVAGGFIVRELNSYHDPLQCRKMTCDCGADYHTCADFCDGTIQPLAPIERNN